MFLEFLKSLFLLFLCSISLSQAGPVIDVWYGNEQQFGNLGIPQQWVNILGNISAPDGISQMSYSLNNGPDSNLSIGPDTRRLLSPGDFNIEIDRDDLIEGRNRIDISAADMNGKKAGETVFVDYTVGKEWAYPWNIDWSQVTNAQNVVYIVDGNWTWDEKGIRPQVVGYDRTFAVGDVSWRYIGVFVFVFFFQAEDGIRDKGM